VKDAHRLLRDATREAHERLDALFMGFDLTDADGYARFVGAQAGALLPVEAALGAGAARAVVDDWNERRRGGALADDARRLSLDLVEEAAPTYADPVDAAGALYVLEGSRHGARQLRKMVPDHLPKSFLDTEQEPGKWPKLLERIDLILYETHARDALIAAALSTFEVFERSGRRWMND
jgi:heme oxygenase (biliverdin-IX-beta and delta-forming)